MVKDISFLPAFFVTSLMQQIKKLEEGMNSNFWLELLQFTLKKKIQEGFKSSKSCRREML